jgi:hypothetical protein
MLEALTTSILLPSAYCAYLSWRCGFEAVQENSWHVMNMEIDQFAFDS